MMRLAFRSQTAWVSLVLPCLNLPSQLRRILSNCPVAPLSLPEPLAGSDEAVRWNWPAPGPTLQSMIGSQMSTLHR